MIKTMMISIISFLLKIIILGFIGAHCFIPNLFIRKIEIFIGVNYENQNRWYQFHRAHSS